MSIRDSFICFFYDSMFGALDCQSVLDVGSGSGKMMDYFTRKNKKATGVDLHPARADIQKMDFLKNKFPNDSFDLVFTAHVIEHLPEPEKFVRELLRVSKKYVCVIAPLPGKKFWDQPDHLRPYTVETLKRIFHLNKWIRAVEFQLPFFEPVAFILFDKADSRIVKK